ncbi:MAG: protein kinase domain-containing protein [Isosphaeraceae bacterium]
MTGLHPQPREGRCPSCGAILTAGSPGSLFPQCLPDGGMERSGPDDTALASSTSDMTVSLAPAFRSVLAQIGETLDRTPHVLLRDTDPANETRPQPRPSSGATPGTPERAERYEFFGEIARGGMGAVIRGRDLDLGRELALKVLLESHREKPEFIKRFVEEAQIAGQLQHPGVVPVYELGTFPDFRPFFTMKLVKGRTLDALLGERGRVSAPSSDERTSGAYGTGLARGTGGGSPDVAPEVTEGLHPLHDDLPRFLSIFESVCQTMAYAHARGVIHRDLKPANVMVGSFGEVQVMDWGLAKVMAQAGPDDERSGLADAPERTMSMVRTARSGSEADASLAGSVLGTPSFMAPEQARGEIGLVDERADVFGLGAILCVILTGRPVFGGQNVHEILSKASRGDVAGAFNRLDASRAELELIQLAKHCLAPAREDRPRTAQQVVQRVTAYLTGVQERLRRAELARVEETARRRLTVAVAASIVGLMVLGGGGWAYLQQYRAGRRAATERVVNQALDEATLFWGQAQSAAVGDVSPWSTALNAATKAEGLLAAGESGRELQDRVRTLLAALAQGQAEAQTKAREARRDRELLDRLAKIREARSVHMKPAQTDVEYTAAFRDFGIDFEKLDPKEAGKRLASRSAPVELAAFLDDWVHVRLSFPEKQEGAFWRRLNEAARAADPDPWRDALRAQVRGSDRNALSRLADDQKALEGQPATSLLLLARWLQILGDRARTEAILLRAWRRQPNDYWVNDQLGWHYLWGAGIWTPETKPAVVARYYSVAVAVRPQSFAAHMGLGVALCPIQLDRGVDELRESIRLNPNSAAAHINLAIGLNEQGKLPELVAEYREAIRLQPDSPLAHEGLALGLYRLGKLADGIAEWREAIRLQPDDPEAHNNLAFALAVPANRPRSDYDEALAHARRAAQLQPNGSFFGTLALAEYRAGQWALSLAAGERSLAMTKHGDANVWFAMALASWRKGDQGQARAFFDKAADWAKNHPRMTDDDQRQLWSEAAQLLGRPGPPQPGAAPPPSDDASKLR